MHIHVNMYSEHTQQQTHIPVLSHKKNYIIYAHIWIHIYIYIYK